LAHYHWYSSTEVWLVVIPLFFAACFAAGFAIANRMYNQAAPQGIRSQGAESEPSQLTSE
jgi:hypothetical protein